MAKKKIAILGGGPGGISAAFELTSKPEWRDQFEVTVYQLGWRLGGKCASGRGEHERIEEHGLHLLGGSYENAFRMLRAAYEEVGWNWEDHFQGRNNVVMEEMPRGAWEHWPFAFHDKPGTPGDGAETLPGSIEEMIERLLHWMHRHTESLDASHPLRQMPLTPTDVETVAPHHHFLSAAWHEIKSVVETVADAVTGHAPRPHNGTHSVVRKVEEFAAYSWEALEDFVRAEAVAAGHGLEDTEKFMVALAEGDTSLLSDWATQFRRDYILLMTIAAHVIGLTRNFDAIQEKGFDALDDIEYKDWIRQYDPSPRKVAADGAPIGTLYELVFAYRDGELKQPNFSAGVGVRSLWRLCFNYKGAIWYQMQGGTGDIIFGPLYQVLKQRGVHFKFFHRVENLHLSADGNVLESIDMTEQVKLKAGLSEYEATKEYKGLWTWPNQPFYEQLELTDDEIAELRALQEEMNGLESNWSPWRAREKPLTLRAGEDFDEVILAISRAALPDICSEIIAAHGRWNDMVNRVETVETICTQLWMNRTMEQLGWSNQALGEHPFIANYAKPLSASGDYSTLAVQEAWPAGQEPQTIWYFCSSWNAGENPPPSNTDFPARTKARYKQESLDWLHKYFEHLFPDAFTGGQLNWNVMIDPQNRTGQARFDAQYWRVNINPSDHYVLSAPGSSAYRLRADESGVENLILAGDWTNTGFNLGCVEASVMSGLMATRAVVRGAGLPFDTPIVGEKDFPWL